MSKTPYYMLAYQQRGWTTLTLVRRTECRSENAARLLLLDRVANKECFDGERVVKIQEL